MPDGCKPSPASSSGRCVASRVSGVMSMKATPASAHNVRAAALWASISRATVAASRPIPAANGVTPQSGIDSMTTRRGSPFA